jgi:hypothetical protein
MRLLALLAFLPTLVPQTPREPAAPAITWHTDLAAARALAAERHAPLLVTFRCEA